MFANFDGWEKRTIKIILKDGALLQQNVFKNLIL